MELKCTLKDTVDHYLTYYNGTKQKVSFETDDGKVTYYADEDNPFNGNNLLIYYIESKVQKQGTFKRFIQYIIDKPCIKQIEILAIENRHLDNFLGREKWIMRGADRVWTKPT